MKRFYLATLFFAALSIAFASTMVLADGVLVPGRWPPPRPVEEIIPAFSVKYHHVDVTIEGQLARTRIDQVFRSEYDREMEATYIFPIPEGAVIKEFNMWIGKEKVSGKLLDAAEARRIYEDIVRTRKDPALLEYAGRGIFKASVFPIPPHGEKRIEIEYSEVLPKNNNIVRYTYPLNTERFSSKPLETVRVSIDIHSDIPIKNVYSPTHNMSIRHTADTRASASYEEKNVRPETDLSVYYTLSDDDIGLGLITNDPVGEDGFFLLLASPRAEIQSKKVASKDVVFVMDRTGSMSGEKIEQAREALKFCLRSLNEGDRFNVVPFNESPDPLFRNLADANKDEIAKAVKLADSLDATGGTNIDEAMRTAGKLLDKDNGRPRFIVFLTDGQPTVGITDVDEILSNMKKEAPARVRLFVFGVGYDVNTDLLDRMTTQQHGSTEYVRPSENIEVKVSAMFSKISYPVLSDLDINWGSMEVYDVFPRQLPDLFKGTQVVISGRYRGKGNAKITLTGMAAGVKQKFTLGQSLDESAPLSDFVPLLWAQRKIAYLVDEIRQKGQNKELVDEIIRLSKKYGIITEYTSFLVEEPMDFVNAGRGGEERAAEKMAKREAVKMDMTTGGSAVNQSMNMNAMKDSAQAPSGVQSYFDEEGSQVNINAVRNVGQRTFFKQGNNWVENNYNTDQKVLKVKAYSDAYFQILNREPGLGQIMSLSSEVLFLVNGNAVQVASEGEDKLSDKQLMELFGK